MLSIVPTDRLVRMTAITAMVFGALTLYSGGATLFGGADQGNIVLFVLWFNFLAGWFYIAAGVLMFRLSPRALILAGALCLATLAVFALLGWHVSSGGAYENRTVGAMTLRSGFWLAVTAMLALHRQSAHALR